MLKKTMLTSLALITLFSSISAANPDLERLPGDNCRLMCSLGGIGSFVDVDRGPATETVARRTYLMDLLQKTLAELIKDQLMKNVPCSKFCVKKDND